MAESVTHRVTDDGTHEIGVTVDKLFVPFASLAAYRFEQLREAEAERVERADEGKGASGSKGEG